MKIQTHLEIDQDLCGKPIELREGFSRVRLTTTREMAADDAGLVHGRFIFGLADYAAMIAVNDPNVVLGAADVTFLKPVKIHETIVAEAAVGEVSGKKNVVNVTANNGEEDVFSGTFICFVLDKHVLEN